MNPLYLLALLFPAQTGTLDQVSPMSNASFNGGSSGLTWQAEVATGVAGTLEGFELSVLGSLGATLNVSVLVGPGWNVGTPAWSGVVTTSGTGGYELHFVDVSSAGIALNAGDLWVIQMSGSTGVNIQGSYVAPPGTPLYPQPLYLNGPGCFADCGWRLGFNTYMLTGPSGPVLAALGTCPGPITLSITNATPNANVAVLYGQAGTFVKPTNPCMGLTLNIANPTLGGMVPTSGAGAGSLSFNSPPAACGRTVQAVDVATCTASNAIVL
jgi:hypothetical protein